MSDADRKAYLAHMDNLRVQKDVLDSAKLEGLMEGKIEGKIEGKTEVAKNMKSAGLAVQTIMQFTGLTQEQIDQL